MGETSHPVTDPKQYVYGRRLGRPLRTAQAALFESLLPRLRVTLSEPGGLIDFKALFGDDRPVWLEIGFGHGGHLAYQAQRNPGVGVIGAEPFINGVAGLLGRIEAAGLTNVRIWPDVAGPMMAQFPAASLERVFILFADPWPKKRHNKRRLIDRPLLDQLAVQMKPGGLLRLASDDRDYIHWMLERLVAHPAFATTAETPADWLRPPEDWPGTHFEARAQRAGIEPAYLDFRRI
jgi:tRNA (guanine-N7-)-methyltransferase